MDTLTHALSGALLARAVPRSSRALTERERLLAGFLAAAFPDIDFLLFWLDPSHFLDWHRAWTHSLVLLPAWAWLLAVSLARLRAGTSWRDYYWVCALGLAIHIAGDVITIYGTKVFYPVSRTAWAWGLSFDINPYIGVIIAVGLAASWLKPPRRVALSVTLAIAGLLSVQALVQRQALAIGRDHAARLALSGATIEAIPQPLSPFQWNLILSRDGVSWLTHLDLLARHPRPQPAADASRLARLVAGYQPASGLVWHRYSRFGDRGSAADEALAEWVWQQEPMRHFRRFAVRPAFYRLDRSPERVCVWFTDLRHVFPNLGPSFRYGLCREGGAKDWRPYRLRYFSRDTRQGLWRWDRRLSGFRTTEHPASPVAH